ncbi:hypothetical protein [Paraflavitalea speifideaquila]|uniref:hypothetical protein n=1 Tax=Paraflavitalea speifideaquila TaxID=3076558 RepID=UPI0028F05524|nr:hypothetical protein [Paraflavitalea speifideiaquila]
MSFQLNTQDVGYITPLNAFRRLYSTRTSKASLIYLGISVGASHHDLGTHFLKQVNIAHGNAGVHDIANNGNFQAFQLTQFFAYGKGIE